MGVGVSEPWDAPRAVAMFEDGLSYSAIGRVFGLGSAIVCRRLDAAIVHGWGMPKPALTQRPCLGCGTVFGSEGKHSRLCRSCKGFTIWDGPTEYATPGVSVS